ncbi:MAG: SusD/RagB family nutrient-binding outer membrane lipoprotein [Bacteroidales bacterium]|nr:SusD/RagB family nutrient-binding outer membrane lipoprotein [Bacteroidales bacterium]
MKIMTKPISIVLLVMQLVILSGCDLEEANVNPNDVTSVPANVLLPFNQERTARLMAGTTQVMAGIFMQYYRGVENHPLPIQTYRVDEALYTEWNFQDYYNGPMVNLAHMIEIAETDGNMPHYVGIGKTLLALCYGNVTSLWGDVPFTEALKGSEFPNPKYDSQETIYENIQLLLDEAIAALEKPNLGLTPSSDDLIFGGNTNSWLQVAYSLKARYYMHLTKRVDDLSYNPAQKALEALEGAIISSDFDLEYQYGFSVAEQNPFYSFCRLDYIVPNTSFTNMLLAMGDPRRSYLYRMVYGVGSLSNSYFTSPESSVLMITHHEVKFIEAEARLRLDVNDPLAQDALQDAVRANIQKLSRGEVNDATIEQYITNNATLTGDFNADLETIMKQKYIAMFASIESWTDYRRTGYPNLTPNEGGDHNQNPGGYIPRRLPYCQTERLYNPNVPSPLPNLQDRFWWDQE